MALSSKTIRNMVGSDVDRALANIDAETPKPSMADSGAELKAAVAPKNDLSFSEAFKANRMAGNKTFTWKGKSYTTKMAGEGAAKKAPSKPAAPAVTRRETPAVGSRQNPIPAKKDENVTVTAKSTRDNTAAGRRARFGEALDSINPIKGIARGIDYLLAPPAPSAPARPEPNRAQRLEAMRQAAEAPGASGYARSRYQAAQESGMYKKGGKVRSIDGAAVRGKTRAMRKK